jgi:predicted nucleotidyltransferase
MNRLIKAHNSELLRLCQLYRVHRLELFGSSVKNEDESQIGDLDFLVEFQEPGRADYADAYFGLRESLQTLFNKPIDLVMRSAIRNPYFLESIEQTRIVLYAA